MKFGKQLSLGTFPPWRDHYISYNRLKRIINRQRFILDQQHEHRSSQRRKSSIKADEYTPLSMSAGMGGVAQAQSGGGSGSLNDDNEISAEGGGLENGAEFFPVIKEEMEKINEFFLGKLASLRVSLEEITGKRRDSYHIHHTSSGNQGDLLILRDIYVELAALRSYCDLNRTGFYKILKKYDKTMEERSMEVWMPVVDRQVFAKAVEPAQLMDVVTSLVSRDKLLEWERFATEHSNRSLDDIFPSVRVWGLCISLLIFAASLFVPMVTPNDPVASRCMSLLLFVIGLWVTEAIPYFATSLLIPALVVFLGVLKDAQDPTKPMSTELAAQFVLNHIFNHTTMLLLGGYTISCAFSSCQLELRIASMMQGLLGDQPHMFILSVMFLGLFLSMWISNHTAPILCTAIILPVVRDLPSDSRFSKALLIALAFGCNFGGMMTPIASLQNVLAVSYLEQSGIEISFGKWMLVAIPFCVVCVLIAWCVIIAIIKPDDVKSIPVIVHERGDAFGKKKMAIIVLSLIVILFFATSVLSKSVFGDIGIISLCYLSIMFGSGMLTEVDFNSLSWHTLFLVGGGNVLGKAVQVSGLLEYLADGIMEALPLKNPWFALIFILFFVMTISTFISHTVSSIILMPIIARIGVTLQIPEVVVIGSAFAVSGAMALPFSSFPNVNSLLILDDFQRPYLNVRDFLQVGLPMSLLTVVLIATVGFAIINLVF